MRSERSIEKAVCRWAKLNDIWAWKITVIGWMGLPDRLFIFPDLTLVFIEFKAQGKPLRALQKVMHKKLIERGFDVFTVDDRDEGVRILTRYL